MAFIDPVKAFDSVNRKALWRILELDGCPPKFISVIRLLHDNMNATVPTNHGPGEAFNHNRCEAWMCHCSNVIFNVLEIVLHLV